MANIKIYLDKISDAQFGEEVRSAIYEAIKKVNDDNELYQSLKDEMTVIYSNVSDFFEQGSDTLEKIEQENNKAKQNISDLNSKNASVLVTIETLTTQNSKAEQNIENIKSENKKAEDSFAEYSSQYEEIKSNWSSIKEEMDELFEKVNSSRNLIDELKSNYEIIDQAVKDLEDAKANVVDTTALLNESKSIAERLEKSDVELNTLLSNIEENKPMLEQVLGLMSELRNFVDSSGAADWISFNNRLSGMEEQINGVIPRINMLNTKYSQIL